MIERRYVIIDTRRGGDIFTDILAKGTTKKEALGKLQLAYLHLTPAEQNRSTMELARLAVADGDRIIGWDDEEYQEALGKGWDTFAAYTPLDTMEVAR